ncbi:MAG: tetratricopeptide repeat protein, partial [Candidatus Eiseniibacteriota bacterium]
DTLELLRIAARARHYQEHGEYAAALGEWTKLAPRVPADSDLELATAIDEARSGRLEPAATRLAGALLSAAAIDTLPPARHHPYTASREGLYLNGSFDGWHWYVWRARAEVAAARGRWDEAAIAARQCVAARPASGKDWLLLAVCAGRAGWAGEARAAARQAVTLDRGVPEAHYLDALWAWKDGRRSEAQAGFRAALDADAGFNPAAVALVRSRLPGTAPDSLPSAFLTGPRAVGMLTSPTSPKLEDRVKPERGPRLTNVIMPRLSDSLQSEMLSRNIKVALFVDPEGRVILHELQWYEPGTFPTPVVSEFAAVLALWRFAPRVGEGNPRGTWVELSHVFTR